MCSNYRGLKVLTQVLVDLRSFSVLFLSFAVLRLDKECGFFCPKFISFCIALYFEIYFHAVYVASFAAKRSHQIISVIFAFILVLRLPFVVRKVYQP